MSTYPINKYALILPRLRPSTTDKPLTFEKNIKTKERQTFKFSCLVFDGPAETRDRSPWLKVKTKLRCKIDLRTDFENETTMNIQCKIYGILYWYCVTSIVSDLDLDLILVLVSDLVEVSDLDLSFVSVIDLDLNLVLILASDLILILVLNSDLVLVLVWF